MQKHWLLEQECGQKSHFTHKCTLDVSLVEGGLGFF